MNTLLVIEASTAAGSVALIRDDLVIESRDVAMGVSREDALLPAIVSALDVAQLQFGALTGIVCGAGPGSFTSLRIAAALCKGIATANETPLYAVPSLLLAGATLPAVTGRYLMHSDALRGERFATQVEMTITGRARGDGVVTRVASDAIDAFAAAAGCTPVAVGARAGAAGMHEQVIPHARAFVRVDGSIDAFGPVSLAEWEPAYGRLAEAQVKWEVDHGRPLPAV